MSAAPAWGLSVAYWLHMLATVIWIGGLAAVSVLFIPAARRSLESQDYARLLGVLQRRLDPLAWMSLVVLLATGMFQMSASPNYEGFLAISNPWAVAILAKHLVFGGMVGVSAYMNWALLPRLRRTALLQAAGQEAPAAAGLQQQEVRLLRLNLILGVVILALTAIARAA